MDSVPHSAMVRQSQIIEADSFFFNLKCLCLQLYADNFLSAPILYADKQLFAYTLHTDKKPTNYILQKFKTNERID